MNRVYISKVLSADLISRSTVHNLCSYIADKDVHNTIIDFSDVRFASRSFIDEFYNVIIKNLHVKIENVPTEIKGILKAVENTQNKSKTISNMGNVKTFSSVDDFCSFFSAL